MSNDCNIVSLSVNVRSAVHTKRNITDTDTPGIAIWPDAYVNLLYSSEEESEQAIVGQKTAE